MKKLQNRSGSGPRGKISRKIARGNWYQKVQVRDQWREIGKPMFRIRSGREDSEEEELVSQVGLKIQEDKKNHENRRNAENCHEKIFDYL